ACTCYGIVHVLLERSAHRAAPEEAWPVAREVRTAHRRVGHDSQSLGERQGETAGPFASRARVLERRPAMSHGIDDTYEIYEENLLKARKGHSCHACDAPIRPG